MQNYIEYIKIYVIRLVWPKSTDKEKIYNTSGKSIRVQILDSEKIENNMYRKNHNSVWLVRSINLQIFLILNRAPKNVSSSKIGHYIRATQQLW